MSLFQSKRRHSSQAFISRPKERKTGESFQHRGWMTGRLSAEVKFLFGLEQPVWYRTCLNFCPIGCQRGQLNFEQKDLTDVKSNIKPRHFAWNERGEGGAKSSVFWHSPKCGVGMEGEGLWMWWGSGDGEWTHLEAEFSWDGWLRRAEHRRHEGWQNSDTYLGNESRDTEFTEQNHRVRACGPHEIPKWLLEEGMYKSSQQFSSLGISLHVFKT